MDSGGVFVCFRHPNSDDSQVSGSINKIPKLWVHEIWGALTGIQLISNTPN